MPFRALIAAAGSGVRVGGDTPKQYRKIGGKTVLRHTIEAFLACPGLQELRVVIDSAHEALYREAVTGLFLPTPVPGGASRSDSVQAGLKSFTHLNDNDVILIHDAARPLVRREDIEAVANAATPAAALALPVADTLRRDDGAYVDRNGLWSVQTPQGFHYGLIRRAHEQNNVATDDTSLVAALGHDVVLVPGSRRNFKITTADDMALAEQIMEKTITRTGFGYDVHAFEKGDSVRLCGVDIPFNKKLAGHSDADVGLHAITDAILGAIAAGDIGQHFPPSDQQWKNADSAIFLRAAVDMVPGRIVNLDITLICEAPKIGPYREAMQKRVAEICGITPGQVGIKATTTEGLGFTGRGEGIAAQAVATVEVAA